MGLLGRRRLLPPILSSGVVVGLRVGLRDRESAFGLISGHLLLAGRES